jgi:hypothetical protein
MDTQCEKTWRVRLDWESLEEANQDIQNSIKIFFPAPPVCSIAQVDRPIGRATRINANLLYRKTTVVIELSMPTKLARHDQGLSWLLSAFDCVESFTFFCPLNVESNLEERDDPVEGLDTVQR